MTKPGNVVATDAEIDAALERGRAHDKQATKIVQAEYDRERDQIWAVLSTGATITVPRRNLARLDAYQPGDFGSVQIEPPGYGLWFDKPDIGVRIEGLLRAAGGENLIRSIAAKSMGSAKTEKKAEAARKNGIEGGRPSRERVAVPSAPSLGSDAGAIPSKKFKPGQVAPRSGEYKIVGPRGGQHGSQTIVRGEPLPPTPTKGSSYEIARPAKNQAGKRR